MGLRCLACVADERNEAAGNAFVLGTIMARHVAGTFCGKHFALTVETRQDPFNPPYECEACRDRRGYIVNPGIHWVPCKHCRPGGARPGEEARAMLAPRPCTCQQPEPSTSGAALVANDCPVHGDG